MIPLATRRAAERRQLEAKVTAYPSPVRFRTHALNVLLFDPAKAREMKVGGFGANWSGDCYLVLPLTDTKPPESETELIDIQDWSGSTHAYMVTVVTPLFAENCYRLSLRPRSMKAQRSPAPGA
jgi:hypothetical protein